MTVRPSILKRNREQAKREKAQEKAQKRAQRANQPQRVLGENEEDPDIAGIVPGPQPILEE